MRYDYALTENLLKSNEGNSIASIGNSIDPANSHIFLLPGRIDHYHNPNAVKVKRGR